MKQITILLSYYNQTSALQKHIQVWQSYPKNIKDMIQFQIIDDCSHQPAKQVLDKLDLTSLNIELYRVLDNLYCNIAGVRNLGAREAKTEWILILDMDTIVTPTMASQLLQIIHNKHKIAFKFNRKVINNPKHPKNNQIHPAVTLIKKEDYWNIGGCEEDLVGHYGQTDPSFWYKARNKITVMQCNNIYLNYLVEGEADINRDTKHNIKLVQKKMKTNSWSKDYVRFRWERVIFNKQ